MGLDEIVHFVADGLNNHYPLIVIISILCATFLEVSKIKINPWSSLGRFIGKALNKEVSDKLDKLESELKTLKSDMEDIRLQEDLDKIEAIHDEIFAFASSCKKHEEHTVKQFQRIFEKHQDYEKLIEKHKMTNGVMEIEMSYIRRTYDKCLDNDAFLKLDEDDE